MRTSAFIAVAAVLGCAASCKRDVPAPVTPPPPPPSAAAAQPAVATTQGPVSTSLRGSGLENLFEVLRAEERARPAGAVTVEAVLEALSNVGIKLKEKRQFLGKTVGASYCAGAPAESGLGVSVCEYPNEAAAKAGREKSLVAFRAIKRELALNRQTLLTLTVTAGTPEVLSEAQRAIEAFRKLR